MNDGPKQPARRAFLQQVAVAGTAPAIVEKPLPPAPAPPPPPPVTPPAEYPRVFTGRNLAMLAFPLGGVGAGSLSLGGRGQLRDWEIFNRPDKGNSPNYAFPSIWVRSGNAKPIARVLESRMLPPYEGSSGLGSNNAPGLSRLASATFTGEFPLARIDFRDARLPVKVSLEAFTPFIPLDAEDSGLPVAYLRYRVTNPGRAAAQVSIAWSIENPASTDLRQGAAQLRTDGRLNQLVRGANLEGIVMTNPDLPAGHALEGEFALAAMLTGEPRVTSLRGWPKGRWWNSPMLFWDDFTADGELGPEPEARNAVGSVCLSRTLAPGASADFTFILAWRYPNRTPARCGWSAPKGDENTVIGNHYCQRFPSAWKAVEYAAANLPRLEKYTRLFAASLRASTLPAAVKEAASANLSTLVSTTCFRTADGEFHGFEGVHDKSGCCHGNCTHVWNYETTTNCLFPTLARSLRKAAFGYSLDDAGAMHFRQSLPDGKKRSGYAAADGQMGQIVKVHHDWRLSGDNDWLLNMWPRVKKALEFAWVPGGWDADRDGVLEGVQHNTYDVEFYGPNPQCGIYYLAALRAGEAIARQCGDAVSADEYYRLYLSGRQWIEANLFNGEYYVQKIKGVPRASIAPSLMSDMGSDNTEQPEYQVGEGCLVDQLVGQYLATAAGLGPLLDQKQVRKTLESIYKYNRKRNMFEHDSVQRTFALNDETAMVICDYGKAKRPHIPFPYYAEVMTGFEYSAAIAMIDAGMVQQGVECIGDIRRRYDGERRNPWDEAECGHHYARAMAAWSGVLSLSGFQYFGARGSFSLHPKWGGAAFRCFWSTGTGWGTVSLEKQAAGMNVLIQVEYGALPVQLIDVPGAARTSTAKLNGQTLPHELQRAARIVAVRLERTLTMREGDRLTVSFAT